MDYQVQKAQQWVNRTYQHVSGYFPCPESGSTGWSTMYSLTRALQHELGIVVLSDNFGDGTMAAMIAHGPVSPATANMNLRTLVEAALYCKGYSGGGIDGYFGLATQSGIGQWKTDMGFMESNSVSAKEMRTLLNMDAYVLLPGGDSTIQSIQRWMNGTYISRRDYRIIPCDGYFSRDVQRGLMLAIQYSIGMADGVANGNFGPGTRDGLRTKGSMSIGATDGATSFVKLFKASLVFNRVAGVDWPGSTFTSATSAITRKFQAFCLLPESGSADYQTWCSLLVSTGDPDRQGAACDCMTPLNDARAQAIKNAGYTTVGRYISGGTQKLLTASEIQIIFSKGLSFFPIYQEYNNALTYFSISEGRGQGENAHASALNLGLPSGSIIYFAVDYDATGDEIWSHIVPFFQGVNEAFRALGNRYSVGVYGSRNVCSTISSYGLAVSSFVSGMSTGFSGNLGFSLPSNWAFDQIRTLTLAASTPGEIEIDNNIKSNRDPGISSLTAPINQNAAFLTWVIWLEARALEWWNLGHQANSQPQLVAHFLRTYWSQKYNDALFDVVSGPVDNDFVAYCYASKGRPDAATLRDPKTGLLTDVQHFGASIGSVFHNTLNQKTEEVSLVDFGGWAGDLITAASDTYKSGVTDANAYTYAYGQIGNSAAQGSFSGGDMLADVDAMVFGLAIKGGGISRLSGAIQGYYANVAASRAKYEAFVSSRFSSRTTLLATARATFAWSNDVPYSAFRAGLWNQQVGMNGDQFGTAVALHPQLFDGVAAAFVDVVYDKYVN